SGAERLLRLEEVEALLDSQALVVDACRLAVREAGTVVSLARRPVLFALARALAEAWPADVPRQALVARAFRGKEADESYRALRRRRAGHIAVLARPFEEGHAAVLAFLADGESWSSSALALALGTSQRSVQRALD